MVTLTKALAVELGPLGIRVNAVRAAALDVMPPSDA
jgi:NAD(P)-dependent dehydrogenase (short-subunit alcohol dehydrogenase family)